MATYQLQWKASLWWEEMRIVHNLEGKEVDWEEFQRLFKGKYLNECYFDDRAKEFHDLKLGQMAMDEMETKFTHLLHYIPYLKDENEKNQCFLNCSTLF